MPGKISPESVKKARKMLLLNLVLADLALLGGLFMSWQGGKEWRTPAIALIVLGIAWAVLSVRMMMKLRRFLASNKEQ